MIMSTSGAINLIKGEVGYDLDGMIILRGYPLALVDHFEFRVFVKNLKQLFGLVTSNTVKADCIEIYAKERLKVCEVLDKLLANPASVLMCGVLRWDMDRKLFFVAFDSGASSNNIVCRIKDRLSQNRFLYLNDQLFDVRCAANVVNLMVQDAPEALSNVTTKIRESIRYVKSSQSTQAKFNELALQVGIESHKSLCIDNPSLWDSTYSMLKDTFEYRRHLVVSKNLNQTTECAHLMCIRRE
ncbi:zinc finger BED domain-containing protein RICESLEEPER 2 [Citrus sinensis]|nr:zinc finger BED domain-containing protein RICESLEEPER 2 [Citrus sinensis]